MHVYRLLTLIPSGKKRSILRFHNRFNLSSLSKWYLKMIFLSSICFVCFSVFNMFAIPFCKNYKEKEKQQWTTIYFSCIKQKVGICLWPCWPRSKDEFKKIKLAKK